MGGLGGGLKGALGGGGGMKGLAGAGPKKLIKKGDDKDVGDAKKKRSEEGTEENKGTPQSGSSKKDSPEKTEDSKEENEAE